MDAAKAAMALLTGASLVSATPPEPPPGSGVLCLGGFIYFAEKSGNMCRAGQDPEFQQHLARLSDRFDDYIVRNTGGDPTILARFKTGQNLDSEDRSYICEGDVAQIYDRFKAAPAAELDKAVDKLLARDGPPSFGDCV